MSENENLLSGLLRKRAQIAGELEAAQSSVRRIIIDLDSIDQTIRIFKPDIELDDIRPKPLPPRHAAYKGEVARIILGVLRDTHHPMTAEELAMHVMAERDLNTSDTRLRKTIMKRIHACMRHYRTKGVIQSAPGPGKRMLWKLTGQ